MSTERIGLIKEVAALLGALQEYFLFDELISIAVEDGAINNEVCVLLDEFDKLANSL